MNRKILEWDMEYCYVFWNRNVGRNSDEFWKIKEFFKTKKDMLFDYLSTNYYL